MGGLWHGGKPTSPMSLHLTMVESYELFYIPLSFHLNLVGVLGIF